jgi:4-alpha-glucanotransferase
MLITRRQAGVGMHISSLPGGGGIGDIADSARSFIDHLADIGMGVWQFLPLGPTAYGDSPYQPLSAFAGNAMLLGMEPLTRLGLLSEQELGGLAGLPQSTVDYGSLIPVKRQLLRTAAERFRKKSSNGLVAEYEDFLHRHAAAWLDEYALFRILKTRHGEKPWPEWGSDFVQRRTRALDRVRQEHREAIENARVIQFLFDRQWRELRAYAEDKGISLFGDMPIYIALDSSDAWANREMLQLDASGAPTRVAGVPPDYFSEDGQLWGNPLYDWAYHEKTAYRWWIERMRHTMRQTHLVRIDHFRGFESFWSVRHGAETAREGEWLPGPRDALFDALSEALGSLPIVAEDLGVITPEVDELRRNHGLPGMVVLQFEVADPEFDMDAIEENSVCYTGTHDNDTTVGWFRGDGDDMRTADEIVRTRTAALERTGGAAETIHLDMIRLALSSNSVMAIAPMQDYLGLGSEARLNMPGTTMNNWRWRMEADALSDAQLDSMRRLLEESSRSAAKRLDCVS